MLFILIPIAWLTIIAVLVAACRAAAAGDALGPALDAADAPIGPRLTLRHGADADATVHGRRAHPATPRLRAPHRTGRRRIVAFHNR